MILILKMVLPILYHGFLSMTGQETLKSPQQSNATFLFTVRSMTSLPPQFIDDDGGGGSGVRLLVANDDTALLSLALAEMAAACADLSCSVARLSARCADPLLRQFDAPFAALVRGGLADLHRLRYSGARKWTGRCGICSGSWSAVLDAPDGRARPEKERLPRRGIGEEAERPDPSRVSGCDVRTARETDETRARVKASSKEKKTRYRCL
uniref:Uncharacterized protein n=1 Tax=Oryza meridionalis TaxID=40149 RepID=A0A0E0F409_9ORYZ